jgi:hypothetical protein
MQVVQLPVQPQQEQRQVPELELVQVQPQVLV